MKLRAFMLALVAGALSVQQVAAAPIVIPISMVNGHIEIPVTVGGQSMTAVLDSGAASSEIDLGLARRLGLKVEPPGPSSAAAVAGPSVQTSSGWLMSARGVLTVGGWSTSEPVWIEDLSPLAAMGQPAMIIGDDLFRAFVVEVDFEAGKVTLHDRAGFEPPSGAAPLRVEHAAFGYAAPIQIEDAAAKLANLDLGANASLMLNNAYAQQLGILGKPGANSRGCLGLAGEQGCQTGLSVSEVRLGDFTFRDVPVVVPAAGDPVFRNIEANLGLGLLSRFHLWLDLSGGRLWLAPTSHMNDPYKRTLGAAFRVEGALLEAVGVVSAGPAAKAGLKTGDRIVAVDGVRGGEAMSKAIEAALSANHALVFELEDGNRLTIEPGDRV